MAVRQAWLMVAGVLEGVLTLSSLCCRCRCCGIGFWRIWGTLEQIVDCRCGHVAPTAGAFFEGTQWCVQGGAVLAQVKELPRQGPRRARNAVAAEPMRDHLSPFAVFLCVERQGAVRCPVQVGKGACEQIEPLFADRQHHVAHGQRMVLGRSAMLAGPQQEEEADPYHVHGGFLCRGVLAVCLCVMQHGDG